MTVPGIQEHKELPARLMGSVDPSIAAGSDVKAVCTLNEAVGSTSRSLIDGGNSGQCPLSKTYLEAPPFWHARSTGTPFG